MASSSHADSSHRGIGALASGTVTGANTVAEGKKRSASPRTRTISTRHARAQSLPAPAQPPTPIGPCASLFEQDKDDHETFTSKSQSASTEAALNKAVTADDDEELSTAQSAPKSSVTVQQSAVDSAGIEMNPNQQPADANVSSSAGTGGNTQDSVLTGRHGSAERVVETSSTTRRSQSRTTSRSPTKASADRRKHIQLEPEISTYQEAASTVPPPPPMPRGEEPLFAHLAAVEPPTRKEMNELKDQLRRCEEENRAMLQRLDAAWGSKQVEISQQISREIGAHADSVTDIVTKLAEKFTKMQDQIHNLSEVMTDQAVKIAELAESLTKMEKIDRFNVATPVKEISPPGLSTGAMPDVFPVNPPTSYSRPREPSPLRIPPVEIRRPVLESAQTQYSPDLGWGQVAPQNQGHGMHTMSSYGVGKSIQKDINYSISRKGTEGLFKFDGRIEKFENWVRKMTDHLAMSTTRYRTLISRISEKTTPVLKRDLLASEIDGYNMWEIAIELESFTVRWLSEDMCEQRIRLCGNEEFNGMELWRNLFILYSGNNKTVVNVNGLQNFMRFPRCESEGELLNHMSNWQTALVKYGGALKGEEGTLRALFLAILPKDWESKLKPKMLKYPNWQSIHQYARDKLELLRDQEISDALHKRGRSSSAGRKSYINALGGGREEGKPKYAVPIPSMQDFADMINALGNKRRPKPQPKAGARPAR